ncbi:hypothetical protein [Fluviispira multicolorata]|uniref:Long-chain fatty acid transport protein n=1 Tax=Fluviispira multicolorata TaxID=2654512 RepID=A0A833JCG3_9BACT|nr:hypothetical protein [Fluviispira multicolorata]KAB8029800.1 hypothetical protein GCL57_09675 [Fluviispira multicolorata]
MKLSFLKKYLLLYISSLSSMYCFAETLPVDWHSMRAMGMGESFTAFSNDETAIYANPAGLSSTRNPASKKAISDIKFPDFEIGANELMLNNMKANPLEWGTDLINAAKNTPGKQSYLELQSFPEIIFGGKFAPTFMIGFPIRSENKVAFLDTANPNNAYTISTTTATAAIAISNATQRGGFRYGLSIRPNYRTDYQNSTMDTTHVTSTNDLTSEITKNGIQTTSVGIDAGLMFTAADYWFPTLGIAVRNIPTGCINTYKNPVTQNTENICGAIRQGGTDTSPNTSKIDPTELRIGLSLTPRGKVAKSKVNLRLSVDVYPIPVSFGGNNYGVKDVDLNRLLHAGAELYFGKVLIQQGFSIRGGYMEGGATWGISINAAFLSIDYSSYVINDSLPVNSTTQTFVERRHLLGLSCHW